MFKFILIAVFFTAFVIGLEAQINTPDKLKGKWIGVLTIQNTKLRIVFNFDINHDSIVATLDSPDQGAKGIPVKGVSLLKDSIFVNVASITGRYVAVITSDTSMQGNWHQGTLDLPLDIYKENNAVVKPLVDKRNPHYDAIEVKINNNKSGITLAGTLTVPKGAKNSPAVILVTGSGPQNRDEELMGQKPFYRIADYLSSKGIAVLRYDDRGVNESTGNFQTATSVDFAADAEAAFQFLLQQPGIDPKKVGIIGHSEGGMIAPMVASSHKNVAFIVLLAGPGILGKDILATQTEAILKAQGLNSDTIQQIVDLNKELYELSISKQSDAEIIKLMNAAIIKRNFPVEAQQSFQQNLQVILSPWYKSFISFDPDLYLQEVHCPVLALNGSLDLQVLPDLNIRGIKQSLAKAGNKNLTVLILPGLNHLFQQATKGTLDEYSNVAKPAMNDKVLEIISSWIQKL